MNNTRYRWILYLITFVTLGTICIQVYWNYKNYLIHKQQFVNEVQISLDNAVDMYYETMAKKNTIESINIIKKPGNEGKKRDSIVAYSSKKNDRLDSLEELHLKKNKVYKRQTQTDSIRKPLDNLIKKRNYLHKKTDSLIPFNLPLLASKLWVSIKNDTLDLKRIDTLLQKELNQKNINISYDISFLPHNNKSMELKPVVIKTSPLFTESKSVFLPIGSRLKVHFSDATFVILKRILTGVLISTFLVLAVISSLFYLLKIIKHQKKLAEVKNDLISNITHEFKTPIATIGVALESIKDFNVLDDKEKTKDYLSISGDQLSKLNLMVEKLLETATLDSDSLQLDKEQISIVELLQAIINKHKIQANGKSIDFNFSSEEMIANIDVFHFENSINNIIDNAVKYGGEKITVDLKQYASTIEVLISDTGNTLTKGNKDKIFEKFYRIPKGNTHDVKGFGIGLYYAKKIIDKHDGTILLDLKNDQTTFKISLPT